MKKIIVGFILCLASQVFAEDAIDNNQENNNQDKTTLCAPCHGANGNSVSPIWPNLAAQHATYLVSQMHAFKESKHRSDPSMSGMMAGLNNNDMQQLAHYFSQQQVTIVGANKENLKQGEALYRGGNFKKKISACIACHGPQGLGNEQAGFPALSGQKAAYVVKQLNDFKEGKRTTDLNGIMRDIARRMSQKDMEAVANYIQGLH